MIALNQLSDDEIRRLAKIAPALVGDPADIDNLQRRREAETAQAEAKQVLGDLTFVDVMQEMYSRPSMSADAQALDDVVSKSQNSPFWQTVLPSRADMVEAGQAVGFLAGGYLGLTAAAGAGAGTGASAGSVSGSAAAMTPEAYAAASGAGFGTTGTAASVGLGTAATTGAATGSTTAATTMPLNTVEGYTAGTGAGTNTAATGFDWGQWAESLNNPQSLLAIGSGISGIVQGNQQQDQAALAAAAANPWGTSGGYALAGNQLQSLLKDPMQVAATDPSYQLRIQGAQRAMGAYGQDSGAMSIAGANASTDWYNQRLEQLGKLAGAGLNPAQAGQIGLEGYQQGVNTIGQGLGSFGYAAAPTAQTLPQG